MLSKQNRFYLFLLALFLFDATCCVAAGSPIEIKFMGIPVRERIERLLEFLLSFAASLILIFMIGSGIFYAISNGDQKAQMKAKRMLLGAAEGMFVIIFSYALIVLVNKLLTQS